MYIFSPKKFSEVGLHLNVTICEQLSNLLNYSKYFCFIAFLPLRFLMRQSTWAKRLCKEYIALPSLLLGISVWIFTMSYLCISVKKPRCSLLIVSIFIFFLFPWLLGIETNTRLTLGKPCTAHLSFQASHFLFTFLFKLIYTNCTYKQGTMLCSVHVYI